MVNTRRIASAVQAGLTLGACLLGLVSSARALSTSDKPAAILVWPKIVVDTGARLQATPSDTIIEIGNTDSSLLKQAHCFYINANSHCSETAAEPGKVCQDASDCPLPGTSGGNANCVAGWNEIDFDVRVTPEQPLAWRASRGLGRTCSSDGGTCTNQPSMSCDPNSMINTCGTGSCVCNTFPLPAAGVCSSNPSVSCNPNSSINTCGSGSCVAVPSNAGSGIPPTPEDPFVGTLKCIQFDPTQNPPAPDQSVTSNRLIGSGLIEECEDATCTNGVDVERYNAVGVLFKSLDTSHPGEVHLDGTQYEQCPSTLILNHIFDNAPDPLSTSGTPGTVLTDLTLVPCGDDLLRQLPGNATAQYLVFNEFEQRLSTSKKVDCFFEKQLSLIDTGTSSRSIFSFNVQGSLVGQTRIRGVGTAPTGHGLLGVARSDIGNAAGVAYNLQQSGNISGTDIITIP